MKTLTCCLALTIWFLVMAIAISVAVVWTPRTAAATVLSPEASRPLLGAPRYSEREPGIGARGSSPALTAVDGRRQNPLEEGAPITYQGIAGWADPSHGSSYLAMREPRGTRVRLCSTNGCWMATVNDYGPKRSTGSIADIAVVHWEAMTGLPRSRGLGQFTVTILSRPHIALPPTDSE